MRWYWRLLIALAAALLGAMAWRWLAADPGYVLITFAGWSVQTSLLFAALMLAVLLVVLRLLF
ncbi:MAG: heme biosynthesis protein HemY, partial [Xanthomonadales bacterium]|nr:heme biosynthesis protein HemY [Xanthomonadales bacterium]